MLHGPREVPHSSGAPGAVPSGRHCCRTSFPARETQPGESSGTWLTGLERFLEPSKPAPANLLSGRLCPRLSRLPGLPLMNPCCPACPVSLPLSPQPLVLAADEGSLTVAIPAITALALPGSGQKPRRRQAQPWPGSNSGTRQHSIRAPWGTAGTALPAAALPEGRIRPHAKDAASEASTPPAVPAHCCSLSPKPGTCWHRAAASWGRRDPGPAAPTSPPRSTPRPGQPGSSGDHPVPMLRARWHGAVGMPGHGCAQAWHAGAAPYARS